jgi:hypothetical protein
MESKKHYNLSTTEDNGQSITTTNTSTEHPAEILRMMQLAGMETAHMVHQEAIEEEVDSEFKPTPANDKLDLDDYSKKSPESIAKQKKSIQPTLGDNPLEYSIDESEIYEGLMKEFDASEQLEEERTDEVVPLLIPALGMAARAIGGAALRNPIKTAVAATMLGGGSDDEQPVNASKKKKGKKLNAVKEETKEETEEVTEAQSPAQKAAFAKMLAAKNGKKDDTVEEKEETTVEENLEKAQEQINELKEDCSCGHGSDCDCGPDCGCGCNTVNESVNEDLERLKKLAGIKEQNQELKEGTSGIMGMKNSQGNYDFIRVNWDAYPEGLGQTLKKSWNNPEEIEKAISKGHASSIGNDIDDSVFYADKEGMDNNKPKRNETYKDLHSIAMRMGAEYGYIFDNGEWSDVLG